MPRLTTAYPLRVLFAKAHAIARAAARRFGDSSRKFFAAALKQVWAEQKAARAEVEAMKARVLAVVANLAAEYRDMERMLQDWYAANEAPRREPARVLPFPSRRPASAPAVPARRAA